MNYMDLAVAQIQRELDDIKKTDQGIDFWLARELMKILGYGKWQTFEEVIEKAIISCKNSGVVVQDHFLLTPVKSTGGRPGNDRFLLSRGIVSEDLAAEEDLKKIEQRRKKELKAANKKLLD